MRRAARIDSTQREIVSALRAIGATVQPLHSVGRGCPDLLVGFRGRNLLVECKSTGGKLTPDQERWHAEWRGEVLVAVTIDDVVRGL